MLSASIIRSSDRAASYYETDDYYVRKPGKQRDEQGAEGAVADATGTGGPGLTESGGPDNGTGRGSKDDAGNPGPAHPDGRGRGGTSEETPNNEAVPDGQGRWWGAGAKALGLSGAVEPAMFKQLLDGELPNGQKLGTKRGGEWKHTPGWDFTFSAPKSVSVVAEITQDERLFEAHDKAVDEALSWMQAQAMTYRQWSMLGNKDVKSESMVAALFQHDTSREQDPDLHTHAVIINATQTQTRTADGKAKDSWRSVHSARLYDYKMAAGNIYRARLADELQRHGFAIERTSHDGRFELADVPKDVLDLFSKRRKQIVAALNERGLSGPEASAQAALMTRRAKRNIDRADLQPMWEAESKAVGFDALDAVRASYDRGDVRSPATLNDIKQAVVDAVDRLSEPEAVFTQATLLRWTLANLVGKGTVDDASAGISLHEQSGALQKAVNNERQAWTTPRAREQERRVLNSLRNGRDAVTPLLHARDVRSALQDSTLDKGQKAAVELMTTTADRIVGIVGRPGTGKTFMLGVSRELLERAGATAVGLAANSEAARNLQAESGIESGTIHRHLQRVNKDLGRLRKADAATSAAVRAPYEKEVWIVDEATQVSSSIMRRLTYAAERLGARMVLIGDPKQLAAIEAGKPFGLMIDAKMPTAEMDNIRRQRIGQHIAAIRATIKGGEGDIAQAFEILQPHLSEVPNRERRLQSVVEAWRALGPERDKSFILTAGNLEKGFLNSAVRSVLRAEGRLQGETEQPQLQTVFSRRVDRKRADVYEKDFYVNFSRAVPSLGIGQGEYLRVVGSDRMTNTVVLKHSDENDKREVRWNPARIAGGNQRGVRLYRPIVTTVAPGEMIRWTQNDRAQGLTNGQPLKVIAVEAGALDVEKPDGSRITIDTSKPEGRHWDHDYARTVYKSQGGTAEHVIVNAESDKGDLFNKKAFLVGISRHRGSLHLFTDSIQKLEKNVVKYDGEKTSALEGQDELRWQSVSTFLDRFVEGLRNRPQAESSRHRDDQGMSR
jgi:conjugative relaxase-like TrwC/TraI family protein